MTIHSLTSTRRWQQNRQEGEPHSIPELFQRAWDNLTDGDALLHQALFQTADRLGTHLLTRSLFRNLPRPLQRKAAFLGSESLMAGLTFSERQTDERLLGGDVLGA